MPPGPPGIGGFVDSIALLDVAADLCLTHTDIDNVRVRLTYLHCAHGGTVNLPVSHRHPGGACVGRFPEAATRRAEVVLERARIAASHGRRPASTSRPDVLPPKGAIEIFGIRLCFHARHRHHCQYHKYEA